jgi:hypothetical protein
VLLGLEGSDPETVHPASIPSRFEAIKRNKSLILGGVRRIDYDMETDMAWRWDQVLPTQYVIIFASIYFLNPEQPKWIAFLLFWRIRRSSCH